MTVTLHVTESGGVVTDDYFDESQDIVESDAQSDDDGATVFTARATTVEDAAKGILDNADEWWDDVAREGVAVERAEKAMETGRVETIDVGDDDGDKGVIHMENASEILRNVEEAREAAGADPRASGEVRNITFGDGGGGGGGTAFEVNAEELLDDLEEQ